MSKRATLLTTTAAAALVGAMTSGAWAFEVVDWSWTSTVDTDVTLALTNTALVGVADLEKVQTHLGNISASSSLSTIDGTATNINNNATAVSNNQSITTDTPLLLHDLQIGAGAITPTLDGGAPNWEGLQDGLLAIGFLYSGGNPFDNMNEHTAFGLATLVAAGNGYFAPAAITASASVSTADVSENFNNNATAVTNNANYVVDTFAQTEPGLGILVADLNQLGIANVSASASASGLSLDTAGDVNGSATAVGNNLNIRVGPVDAFGP